MKNGLDEIMAGRDFNKLMELGARSRGLLEDLILEVGEEAAEQVKMWAVESLPEIRNWVGGGPVSVDSQKTIIATLGFLAALSDMMKRRQAERN